MEGFTSVPRIDTPRLLLREAREEDLDDLCAALSDPETARNTGGPVPTREETWRKLLASRGLWALFGYGYWAIERKSDGRMIGQAGFAEFKRDMLPAIEGIPEMGWVISPHAQLQGYASEAVSAAMRWADERFPGRPLAAIINHGNAPSIRIAEKVGFGSREEALFRGEPILLFRKVAGSPAAASAASAASA